MKLGVIGAGNMGMAIINGYIKSGAVAADILVYDDYKKGIDKEISGIAECASIEELVEGADIVLLAVKPNVIDEVLEQVEKKYTGKAVIVSIVAGITISYMEGKLGKTSKIVRMMPNTPSLVNEGMSVACRNANVTKEEFEDILAVFRGIGLAEEVPEYMMDVVTGLSGSGPAFVYIFIEALADGAVMNGLPRDKAYRFAAQTVLGSARMVLETGIHPGQLKDMVASPGGTTIAGIKSLEENGFRNAVMAAVTSATIKSKELGNK
jgi:pyrroline-5-carboxylate reductase